MEMVKKQKMGAPNVGKKTKFGKGVWSVVNVCTGKGREGCGFSKMHT